MKKFAIITNEDGKNRIAIEIVSEETLAEYSDNEEFILDNYSPYIVDWFELEGNEPTEIIIYKEGVFNTPTIEEQKEDYVVKYR